MSPQVKTVEVDISSIFKSLGIRSGPVIIQQTPGMYPFKPRLADNWWYFTTACFQFLQKHNVWPGTIVLIGVGNGAEAIAAAKVFHGSVGKVIITDVDTDVVGGARLNVKNNLVKRSTIKIIPLVGSFCEPLTERKIQAHLIHGNIPNLPAAPGADLSLGADKGTFLLPSLYEGYNPPQKFIDWALGAQYAYIQSAREALVKGGAVLTEVGGRVPLSLLEELFADNGFTCEEVLVGFKEQTEALIDFKGYNAFERKYGVNFHFYRYEPSLETLRKWGITGNIVKMSGSELKELLKPHRVTAGQAVKLYTKRWR